MIKFLTGSNYNSMEADEKANERQLKLRHSDG
jgi:hypothetical protein